MQEDLLKRGIGTNGQHLALQQMCSGQLLQVASQRFSQDKYFLKGKEEKVPPNGA